MKTAYLHALFYNSPILLPVFSFLVAWARTAGIIKSDPKDSAIIPTAEFYAFVLQMLSEDLPVIQNQDVVLITIENVQPLFDEIFDNVKICDANVFLNVGKLTLQFFRKASYLQGRMHYEWPEEITGNNRIISFENDTVKAIAGECEKALKSLTIYRSARMLLCQVTFFSSFVTL